MRPDDTGNFINTGENAAAIKESIYILLTERGKKTDLVSSSPLLFYPPAENIF